MCVGRLEWSKSETGQTGFINRMLKPSQLSLQIPVVLKLSTLNEINLKPLVWALAMGSCLGGKHTPSLFFFINQHLISSHGLCLTFLVVEDAREFISISKKH